MVLYVKTCALYSTEKFWLKSEQLQPEKKIRLSLSCSYFQHRILLLYSSSLWHTLFILHVALNLDESSYTRSQKNDTLENGLCTYTYYMQTRECVHILLLTSYVSIHKVSLFQVKLNLKFVLNFLSKLTANKAFHSFIWTTYTNIHLLIIYTYTKAFECIYMKTE